MSYQADDDLLMEFVLAPDDPSGKKILRTPMRVNVEDLARPGGAQGSFNNNRNSSVSSQHRQQQTATIIIDEGDDDDDGVFDQPPSATAAHHQQRTNNNNSSEMRAINNQQQNPLDAHAMQRMKQEGQMDAVEGRRAQGTIIQQRNNNRQGMTTSTGGNQHFMDSEWTHGTFVASQIGRPDGLDDDSQNVLSKSTIGAGGVMVDEGRQHQIKSCSAVNKRSFGPPPLRRFASTGYTNAVWGGDGVRRLLICGGLSKSNVEHEVYEYSLSGQRWRRLECRAEQHTPAGLPIVPLARHSHTASVLLESGQGGESFMIIFGGVGLGGKVVPPEALESRQSRANFEELFGTDPETFAKSLRSEGADQFQLCSVLDLIAGENNQSSATGHTHHNTRYENDTGNDSSAQPNYNAGTVMKVGGGSNPGNQVGVLDDIYELNLKSRVWRKVQVTGCAPPHLAEHTAVMFGNRAVIFGGTTMEMLPADGSYIHFLEAHRTRGHGGGHRSRSYEWSMRAFEPAPPARSRHTAVASSPDTMTVFGGVGANGEIFGDLWMLHNVTSEEPHWVNLQLNIASEKNSNTNKQKQQQQQHESSDHDHDHPDQDAITKMFGRSGHSACMSYGHRLLVVGGQSERGVVSTVLEIQLGRAIVDNEAYAIIRNVRVNGDALPRYCFGTAVSAGDGVSAVVFGGQKTWREDRKKLMMLKNPTPEEIARLRRKAKDQESLTNGVFVFTYPELTGRERKRYEKSLRLAASGKRDEDDSDLSDISDSSGTKEEELPESFLKFIERSNKGYSYTWKKVQEKQTQIDNEAKIYASTKIYIEKKQAMELLDLLEDAAGFMTETPADQLISATANDKEERVAACDELQHGIRFAVQSCDLKRNKPENQKQQFHYIIIEQRLKECHKGLAGMKKIQKGWMVPPHQKEWAEEHDAWLATATEKLEAVSDCVRKFKKAIVEASLKRLEETQNAARVYAEQARIKAEREEKENLAKTAMEHVLEERKRQGRSGSNKHGSSSNKAAYWGKPPPRTESAHEKKKRANSAAAAAAGNQNQKKKNKKDTIHNAPIPEYGEQIPDLEIVVLDNDRNVHSRLVRVCRNEISSLKARIESDIPHDLQPGYSKVMSSLTEISQQVNEIERDLPAAPEKKYGANNDDDTAGAGAQQQQKLKSIPLLQHSKRLIDLGKDLKKFNNDASDAGKVESEKLQHIKDSVDNLDKVARSFRQYWHLTFLSRGYERGGNKKQEPTTTTRPATAQAARGPPRCASVTTGSIAARRAQSPVAAAATGNNNKRAPTPINRRPPTSTAVAAASTATANSTAYPVKIQPLPAGATAAALANSSQRKVEPVNAFGSVNWQQQQQSQQQQSAPAQQSQPQQHPDSWAVLSNTNNNNSVGQQQQQLFNNNNPVTTVPPSAQVDWLRGGNNNNINSAAVLPPPPPPPPATSIGGQQQQQHHLYNVIPLGVSQQSENLQQQSTLNTAAFVGGQQQQQSASTITKPSSSTAGPRKASATATSASSSKPDSLFRGSKNLTPGERRILEARARKN